MSNPSIEITPEYQAVIDAIEKKTPVLFVGGKAGVGKSTLLNYLTNKYEEKLNLALVAPTGIAALNIGGVTINSFFNFPARIMLPKDVKKPKNPDVFRKLNLLFIDEGSMVRANVMDDIDKFLRLARNDNSPFGGVQVVIFGDLFQLPPVVTDQDKVTLDHLGYKDHYFFNAKVFNKVRIKIVELTKVFRQKNANFAEILNNIRVGNNVYQDLERLNVVCAGKEKHPNAVILAATNAVALEINQREMANLKTAAKVYKGEGIEDSPNNLPSPRNLELKVGAKVIFTANSPDHLWRNGQVAEVTKMMPNHVEVDLEGELLLVYPYEWEFYEYALNKSGKMEKSLAGKYTQLPLNLAWAISIHKSQGQTLQYVHINLGRGAFTTGQTYVALSRAVNVKGLSFEKPIRTSDVKVCPKVKAFLNPEEHFTLS